MFYPTLCCNKHACSHVIVIKPNALASDLPFTHKLRASILYKEGSQMSGSAVLAVTEVPKLLNSLCWVPAQESMTPTGKAGPVQPSKAGSPIWQLFLERAGSGTSCNNWSKSLQMSKTDGVGLLYSNKCTLQCKRLVTGRACTISRT